MNKTRQVYANMANSIDRARPFRRFAAFFLAFALVSAFCSSCTDLWTKLSNPNDPDNCEVDSVDYQLLFKSETTVASSKDPVLEKLRDAQGFQVLYVGFNEGRFNENGNAPFVMITTKYVAVKSTVNGQDQYSFPIFSEMNITDSLGISYTPSISTTGNADYLASDGRRYSYEVSTFWAFPMMVMSGPSTIDTNLTYTIDTSLTYTVGIGATNVVAYDGTPLDRAYSFVVSKAANADSGSSSLALMDGLSAAFSCDFSANDPYWEWSKNGGSGSIDTANGKYALVARCGTWPDGGPKPNAYFKRYPFAISEDTFAVRVTNAFPSETPSGTYSGVYISDSAGNPIAVIMINPSGWFQCFGPGSSDGVLQKIKEQSIVKFNYASTVLGIRHEMGILYFYANGNCLAATGCTNKAITNAGLFIVAKDPDNEASASFDDFTIAQ